MDNTLVYEAGDCGSIPYGGTNKEIMMQTKPATYKNYVSQEIWICDDPKKVKEIDGITYLTVHKPDNRRMVMMRKDSLQPVKSK